MKLYDPNIVTGTLRFVIMNGDQKLYVETDFQGAFFGDGFFTIPASSFGMAIQMTKQIQEQLVTESVNASEVTK